MNSCKLAVFFISFMVDEYSRDSDHAAVAASQSTLPESAVTSLRHNVEALRNLDISGERRRVMLDEPDVVLEKISTKESAEEFEQAIRFQLRIDGNRIREYLKYPAGKYHSDTSYDERSFDGETYFSGSADPRSYDAPGTLIISNLSILKQQQKVRSTDERKFELWYLEAAGFELPVTTSKLGNGIRSVVLSDDGNRSSAACREVVSDGRQLLEVEVVCDEPWASHRMDNPEDDPTILRMQVSSQKQLIRMEKERRLLANASRLCRYILDPEYGYAIVEMLEFRKAPNDVLQLMFHTMNSQFQRIEPANLWLPTHCETVAYSYETAPTRISSTPLYKTMMAEVEISSRQTTPFTAEDFQLWFPYPGVIVADYTHAEATAEQPFEYRVPAEIADLERLAKSGSRRIFWIVAGALTVALTMVALIVIHRHAQR